MLVTDCLRASPCLVLPCTSSFIQVVRDDIQEDKNTTDLVMHVADVLEKAGGEDGINLFRFLINPDSFTQTVENIFFTSFLVKERKAAIEIISEPGHAEGDVGDPVICKFWCENSSRSD